MYNWQPEIDAAIDALESDGIILFPTDTIWGLGVDATNSSAVQKLYKFKNRDVSKKMISLIPDDRSIYRYVSDPPLEILDILQSLKTPTSIIYEDVLEIAPELQDQGRAALRVVHSPFAKTLLVQFGKPIVATSANRSLEPSPKYYSEISSELLQKVDYAVSPDLEDEGMTHTESELYRASKDGQLERLR